MPSKPTRGSAAVYQDARVEVFADGTWKAIERGAWTIPDDAQIYAANAGPANINTPWGHRKESKAVSPSGVRYDFWAIASGHA